MAHAVHCLDRRRQKDNGTYPIKIRVTHERKQTYYPTVYAFTVDEYKVITDNFRLSDEHRKILRRLDALVLKANTIIEELNPFSFDAFVLRFTSKGNRKDLLFLLTEKADRLTKDGSISNANLYRQTADLLSKYHTATSTDTELKIATVTPEWLQDLESWMLQQKRKNGNPKYSKTTVSMYLIRVRAVFNEVIDKGELNSSAYPFHRPDNKKGYQIPTAKNNKRALTKEEIMLLYNYQTIVPREIIARDFFMFSYLASGMNLSDVFRLKWTDIKDGQFSFTRKKTEKKARGANKITIRLTPDLIRIMETHGSHKLGNDYIFNILTPGMKAKEIVNASKKAITFINTNLKKIASKIGITEEISSYFARHSYSTILMNSEAPLAFISQQLGHADIKTTQNYLGSFTSTKTEEYHNVLLDNAI